MIQAQLVYFTSEQTIAKLLLPPHGANIGRASGCTVLTQDAKVSQKHAALTWRTSAWHVEDLGSTNGTTVNGTRISGPMPLRHMDVIRCGSLLIRFMIVAGADQVTIGSGGGACGEAGDGEFTALREELTRLKKEQEQAQDALEQESKELAGANGENRALRQALERLRSEHASLRREHGVLQAALEKSETLLRESSAESDLRRQQAAGLCDELRVLQAELGTQAESRHQAERESLRFKERVNLLEDSLRDMSAARDEALLCANQRQSQIDALQLVLADVSRQRDQLQVEVRQRAADLAQLRVERDRGWAPL
ncbi:MAG TPA: FHA domain-containing protein [Pseudomonadota bacterium]|nr:FHA domain-containing protein [Pseudomonadota bacterium]